MAFTRQEMEESKKKKQKKEKLPGLVPFRDGFAPQESDLPKGNIPLAEGLTPQEDVPSEPLPSKTSQPALVKRSIAKGAKKTDKALDDLQEGMTGKKTTKDNKMSDDMKTALLAGLPILIGGLLGGEDGLAAGAEAAQVGLGVQRQEKAGEAKAAVKQQELDIKKDEVKLKTEDAASKERLRISQVGLNKVKQLKMAKDIMGSASSNMKAIFRKLPAEKSKRLGSVMAMDRSINGMITRIESGDNLFELVGQAEYQVQRTMFIDSIARLQSGAAISETEFDMYAGLAPRTVDGMAVIRAKLATVRSFVDDQLKVNGFNRKELGLPAPLTLQSKEELLERQAELLARQGQ